MQKETLNAAESLWEKLLHISLFAYLFLLIFPHVTTPREIAFWMAFLCWIVVRARNPEPFINLNPIILSLSLFLVIAFVSLIIGMEPLENLKRFKGELLIPFLLFLITAMEYKTLQKAKSLLLAPVIAFAIYTLYVLIVSTISYGSIVLFDKKLLDIEIFSNYPQRSITLFPITIGIFLLIRSRLKYLLLIVAILEFTIIVAYGSFTPLLSAVSVLVLCTLFAQPKTLRKGMQLAIVGFIVLFSALILLKGDLPSLKRHKERLNKIIHLQDELKTDTGFSGRILLWRASIDVIKERPLLGYGSGMKKYQYIIQEKFLNKWKNDKPTIYHHYAIRYKDIFYPPHNLFLEITFQFGIFGLFSFLTFICLYSFQLVKTAIKSKDFNFFLILIGGTILSFMIMGLMNNELGNMSGKVLFTVLGVGAARISNGKD